MPLPHPSPTTSALVTGASSGIGAAIARRLAARGHNVILVARRAERLEELATELRAQYAVKAEAIPADLADPSSRADLIETVRATGQHVDILVNNAGFATGGHYVASPRDREVEQVRVLVEAVVELTSAFLPDMVERQAGAVLNVASTAGFQPLPYSAGYSAAKAHTLAFSEALHYEVRRKNVAVTALCPGPVNTEFWEVAVDQPIEKSMPRSMWVSIDAVAAAGLRGLERNKRVVVPGLGVRTLTAGGTLVPHRFKLPVLARAMHPGASR
ncbi:MAG TPA: SDR family oxidoreductase [Nocardioidaceae bacterium]|nr:SDR family oxidoreductase [Nocardioidaceae bacterium]